jgi:hypothetical protein
MTVDYHGRRGPLEPVLRKSMKMRDVVPSLLLCGLALCFLELPARAWASETPERGERMRIQLKDSDSRGAARVQALSALEVSLRTDSVQAREPRVLELEIELKNKGERAVELYFVADEDVTVMLSENGRALRVPQAADRFLTHVGGPQGPIDSAAEAPRLELAPGQTHHIRRRVSEVLVDDGSAKAGAPAAPRRAPLVAGEYWVNVFVRLVTRVDDRWAFRNLGSGAIGVSLR